MFVGLQRAQLGVAAGQQLLVVGVLRLQADALDIDLGQFHRLAGEGAVGGLGLLVRLGLDHAPEILLLEQGHVIGQVVRLEQQAGAIGAVVGRAQFRDLAVLDQALQLGDGAGRTRGGRGRRRRHRRGRRLRVFNLLDRGPGRFGLLGAGASRQTGQGRTQQRHARGGTDKVDVHAYPKKIVAEL